jgi:hypothetical protein
MARFQREFTMTAHDWEVIRVFSRGKLPEGPPDRVAKEPPENDHVWVQITGRASHGSTGATQGTGRIHGRTLSALLCRFVLWNGGGITIVRNPSQVPSEND